MNRIQIENKAQSAEFLYKRQFILASVSTSRFDGWEKIQIANRFYAEVHPDLELAQVKDNEAELTLLGYMIDPSNGKLSNFDILKRMLCHCRERDKILKHTFRYGGRWILIACTKQYKILFSDPGALRSVYYTNAEIKPFVCASQPGLIEGIHEIRYKKDAAKHFIKSKYYEKDKEYWWPAGDSLYRGVKHLSPNHYIDLDRIDANRFWPHKRIKSISLSEGIEQASFLLKRLMQGAATRYSLALGITAGIDSRSLLAACRSIKDQVYYYTLIYYDLHEKSADILIPIRLLKSLDLPHHLLDCSYKMNACFKSTYKNNVSDAHNAWGHIAYGLCKVFPENTIAIKGCCSEIARCYYYKDEYPTAINGNVLAYLCRQASSKYAIAHYENWHNSVAPLAKACNVDILDLFYWEHRIGSWQAMSQLEWDIVHETFSPYNCRELLEVLLSVSKIHRQPYEYNLHKGIIANLWPDLLKESINPMPMHHKIKLFIRKMLAMTKTLEYARRMIH